MSENRNDLTRLDASPAIPFAAKEVIYAHLKIDWSTGTLRFETKPVVVATGNDIPEEQVRQLAIGYVNGTKGWGFEEALGGSPYDIAVRKQSWIIVELDEGVPGWQYATGWPAVTQKQKRQDGDNFGLTHVYPGDALSGQVSQEPIDRDHCKVCYFAVAARRAGEAQGFNFHTEFVQPTEPGKPPHRMIVIFDPDIPDDGNQTIP